MGFPAHVVGLAEPGQGDLAACPSSFDGDVESLGVLHARIIVGWESMTDADSGRSDSPPRDRPTPQPPAAAADAPARPGEPAPEAAPTGETTQLAPPDEPGAAMPSDD